MCDEGGVRDKEVEFPDHYKVMMDKLNTQRKLDQFTDITLIVDGHQFRAHKAVLAACSQFFHKFFQDFTQEPLVEIEGVSNGAFCHLMEFTYTATLALRGQEEVLDVWRAAEYLQMQEAIKALKHRVLREDRSSTLEAESEAEPEAESRSLSQTNRAKKRKIAETTNVITETLPSVEAESEHVEIEVEVGEDGVVHECVMEEVLDAGRETDDSALALLADITSKYQQGAADATKAEELQEEEAVLATKALEGMEGMEVVEVQISDNMFHCDKCHRCFKLYYHLKQHMRSHTAARSDKAYACDHCGKTYAREGALSQHLITCHYHAEEMNKKLTKKVHVCVYCSKQFDHFGHFKEHLRKHTGEKPFECPDCHEKFARNSTLKCHMSACQNGAGAKKGRKKVYECQVCDEVFNSWDQFKDHLVIHTGDKPNHCTHCDQWFTHARDLRTHLQQQHQEDETSMEERVMMEDGVIEGRVEMQDGVMMEGQVELRDGVMIEGPVVLQDGVMEQQLILQDEVEMEGRVETVLIEVEEDGVKGPCGDEYERE